MRKTLYLLLFTLFIASCGTGFNKRKYTGFRNHSHKTESQNKETEPFKCPIIAIDDPISVIESLDEALVLSSIADTSKKLRKEKKSSKEYQSRPREQLNSGGNTSGTNENIIRQKGQRSVLIGTAAMCGATYGLYLLFAFSTWYLLVLPLAGIIAYIGLKLAIAAKRDMDQISDRSSKKQMNRTSTFGFILNLIPLVCTGLLVLMLLISLL